MASITDQFFVADPSDWVDFDQFLDIPAGDDYSAMAPSTSPEMALPYDADMLGGDMPEFIQPAFPDFMNHEIPQEGFLADQSPDMDLVSGSTPMFDDAIFDGYQSYDESFKFRQMVEAQAAADHSVASIKEKRREASIALHLQRLCDATALDLDMSSDSNTSFSSPAWSDCMPESISPQPPSSSPEQTSAPPPAAGNGGFELVLDLNMNTTSNLPKKQKPRSQAQKENYIKARKYGACEKHKKQHKRVSLDIRIVQPNQMLTNLKCNCLEKAAARAGISDVPTNAAFMKRPRAPSIPATVLPEMRSSAVPGRDPSRNPSMPRLSVSLTKKVSDSSPGHDPSSCQPAVQQFVRPVPGTADSTAGHNPQYSVPGVQPARGIGKNIAKPPGRDTQYSQTDVRPLVRDVGGTSDSIPGREFSARTPTALQKSHGSLRKTTVQPTLRWATQSNPGEHLRQAPSTDCNCPRQNSATGNCHETRTLQKHVRQVRRPRIAEISSPTETWHVSKADTSNEKQSPLGVRSSRSLVLPGIDRGFWNHHQSFRQPLAILSPRLDSSSRDQDPVSVGKASSGLLGFTSQVVSCVTASLGGMYSKSRSAIAGAWQSSLPLSCWTESAMLKCLAFAGRRLMSFKKGSDLFQGRHLRLHD